MLNKPAAEHRRITLRDYQIGAINAQWRYWRDGEGMAPIIIAPTGAGKSILIAVTIRELRRKAPHARVMMVAHVKELIQQNHQELIDLAPEVLFDVGIVSAGLGFRYPRDENQMRQPIVAGTIQTLANYADRLDPFDLLVIDEAHLVPRKSEARYHALISALKQLNPEMKMVGYTATPWRLDSGSLYEGEDAMFDGIGYEIGLDTLIDQGHLVRPVAARIERGMDLEKLKTNHGEYTASSQEDALRKRMEPICRSIMLSAAAQNRRRILVFMPGIESCESLAKLLEEAGRQVEIVHSKMPSGDRDSAIRRFRAGKCEFCCNVGILTTGSNIPEIDCVALLRATTSSGLLVQMVGRGLRPSPGKSDCLVLDYGGNFERHGPIDAIQAREPKEKSDADETDEALPVMGGGGGGAQDQLGNVESESYVGPLMMGDSKWPAMWAVESVDAKLKKTYQTDRQGIEIKYRCRDENDYLRVVRRWFFPESERSWEAKQFAREHNLACKGEVPLTNEDAVTAVKFKWKSPSRLKVDMQQRGKWKGFVKVKEAKYYSEPLPLMAKEGLDTE